MDPKLVRTIIVGTKFDQRKKELMAHQGTINDYVKGGGYLPKLPFLFQIPIVRTLDGKEFVDAIDALAEEDLNDCLKMGMEKTYQILLFFVCLIFLRLAKQIGFPNLKHYLESLLLEKYKESIPHTFSILNQKCKEIETELNRVNSMIENMQVRKLRARASDYVIDVQQDLSKYLKVSGPPLHLCLRYD